MNRADTGRANGASIDGHAAVQCISGISDCALYQGDLMHHRHHPRVHRFRYRLSSWLIDIDQLAALNQLTLFGWNHAAPFSFHDADYGSGDGRSPRQFIDQLLAEYQLPIATQVKLLCQIRCLGHVFNPLSVWFCHNETGELYATVYEVRNTFGGRHHYLVADSAPVSANRRHRTRQYHHCTKQFHVSPFMGMGCDYHFVVKPPDERLYLRIRQLETCAGDDSSPHKGRPLLDALWRGQRQSLNNRTLAWQLLRYPLNSIKVLAAIHWQALRLWCKGVPFIRGPIRPEQPSSQGQRYE
ncbi:MAG: DUF1365 domain-containing protein [Marinobacterium sp.]|nr:DUF1365 domain-containing protein [Marinobacterium sp.]